MKIFGGLVLFVLISAAVLVGYVIPTQYHKAIHKKYIPENAKDMQISFKKIGFNQHQTTLTGEKIVITIDSVSNINFLENHLLVSINQVDKEETLRTKIRYEISKNIDLLVEFEDYKFQSANPITLQKPVIKVSTPLNEKLLDEKERINYLLFNTSIDILLEKFSIAWKDPAKPDISNEFVGEKLSLGIGGSSPSPDMLLITTKMAVGSASLRQGDVKNEGKDFSHTILLNSFNISGIMESYKDLIAATGTKDGTPFIFKLMQQMPKLRKTVNFPFVFSNTVKAVHAEGPSSFDLEASIDDPEKGNIMTIFKMKFSAMTPAKMLEDQAAATLSSVFTQIYGDLYYPAGSKNPLFLNAFDQTSVKEKEAIRKDIEQKLPMIFTAYLNTEVEGIKRATIILDDVVAKNLLVKANNSYSLKGEFAQMQVSINDTQNPMETIKNLIPKEEVELLMKENSFVSVYEGQTVPEAQIIPTTVTSP